MSDQGPPPSPWPSDHLTDAERRLARLWRTMPAARGLTLDEEGEPVEMTAERDAILFGVEDALARATAAAATGAIAPAPAAVTEGLARIVKDVGYVRADLVQGVAMVDMIGCAGRLEDAAEALAGHLEVAERRAGRPPLTEAEAVADIAERLRWDRR